MRAVHWLLPMLVWMVLSMATARANYITFTESAVATGTLGSSSFTDTSVTLTVVGNPLMPGLCTGVPNCTVNQGVISVDVSDVGTATFTTRSPPPIPGQGVVDNSGCPCGGMSVFQLPNGHVGSVVLFTRSPSFVTYNVTESTNGSITGPAAISTDFAFPTSAGSFVLNSVVGNSTFTALSTLTQTGGTLTNPATFTQSGVGQISSTIGGLGSEASYEFAWLGGAFAATASVAGASPTGSYLFQLSEPGNPGTVIDRETLDVTDSFSATISDALLAPGDYVIALLADSPNDPMFTIDFATPVNGTAAAKTVPEPSSLLLIAPGLILMFFLGSYRTKSCRLV
jgi:hypothetical protein